MTSQYLDQALTVWPKVDLLPPPSHYEAYVAAAQKFPYLSVDEESSLVEKWRVNQDREAAKKLVLSHLRLVTRVVRDHSGYGLAPGDLAQEGTVGLMKAVQKFDPSNGARLAAYALLWIQAEVREFILLNWRMVRLSGSSAKKLFFGYRKAHTQIEKLGEERFQKVSLDEMAEKLDVSVEEVSAAERYFKGRDVGIVVSDDDSSTQRLLTTDALSKEGWSQSDELPSHLKSPEVMFEEFSDSEHLHKLLSKALEKLPPREREVVLARRLQENSVGLQEMGNRMNISAERVRQLENQGVTRLKRFIFEAVAAESK